MGAERRDFFTSVATLLPILSASILAAVARVPEGYEAPATFYFACYLVTLILTVYNLFLEKNRRNDILVTIILICVILFFGSNLKERRLTRWVGRFPDDPVLISIFNILSLPVIIFRYALTYFNLKIPWSSGLTASIFLLLVYWVFSARLLRRIGLPTTNDTGGVYPSKVRSRTGSVKAERVSILLLVLLAASVRTLPALASRVPAGCDTPFYVATLQGRSPPERFGGVLRHLLYYLFRVIGVVLSLPFPTPLSLIWAVNIIPVIFHMIAAVLLFNLAKSCLRDLKTGLLAGVFLATGIGMLRITWDLYKLLLSIPFALVSLHQLFRSVEKRDRRHGIIGLCLLAVTALSHATLGGVILLALSSLVLLESLSSGGFFSRYSWLLYATLSLVVLPLFLGRSLEGLLFTGWYTGNITSPLPGRPEVGVISILELYRWLGITPLLLAVLGLLYLRGRGGCGFFPSIWLAVSFLLIWQALFHTYTHTGQMHRVELLTSMPVSISAAVGLVGVLSPIGRREYRKRGFSLNLMAVLALVLSVLIVAWSYGGFLSQSMISEPEYLSMTWLLNHAPNTNCGVPRNFDSWTGYYGQIQNRDLPTTFYLDRTATDDSPLYDRVYSGFNRIYVRTDLI